MKKRLFILSALFVLILAYMLIIWFCVPAQNYSDFFATEQIMRILAPKSLLFLISRVFKSQLVVIFLFFSLSLFLFRKLNKIGNLIFSLFLPSVCSFVLNVFLIKPRLIGVGVDYYSAHTIVQSSTVFTFDVTMFDILFAIWIGIITAISFLCAYKWYKTFLPSIVERK